MTCKPYTIHEATIGVGCHAQVSCKYKYNTPGKAQTFDTPKNIFLIKF